MKARPERYKSYNNLNDLWADLDKWNIVLLTQTDLRKIIN
jgi:hypothetical protein